MTTIEEARQRLLDYIRSAHPGWTEFYEGSAGSILVQILATLWIYAKSDLEMLWNELYPDSARSLSTLLRMSASYGMPVPRSRSAKLSLRVSLESGLPPQTLRLHPLSLSTQNLVRGVVVELDPLGFVKNRPFVLDPLDGGIWLDQKVIPSGATQYRVPIRMGKVYYLVYRKDEIQNLPDMRVILPGPVDDRAIKAFYRIPVGSNLYEVYSLPLTQDLRDAEKSVFTHTQAGDSLVVEFSPIISGFQLPENSEVIFLWIAPLQEAMIPLGAISVQEVRFLGNISDLLTVDQVQVDSDFQPPLDLLTLRDRLRRYLSVSDRLVSLQDIKNGVLTFGKGISRSNARINPGDPHLVEITYYRPQNQSHAPLSSEEGADLLSQLTMRSPPSLTFSIVEPTFATQNIQLDIRVLPHMYEIVYNRVSQMLSAYLPEFNEPIDTARLVYELNQIPGITSVQATPGSAPSLAWNKLILPNYNINWTFHT
ncbi:MAG: hypothetical protein QXM12_00605 [Nitrososphaerota archaeon]